MYWTVQVEAGSSTPLAPAGFSRVMEMFHILSEVAILLVDTFAKTHGTV